MKITDFPVETCCRCENKAKNHNIYHVYNFDFIPANILKKKRKYCIVCNQALTLWVIFPKDQTNYLLDGFVCNNEKCLTMWLLQHL